MYFEQCGFTRKSSSKGLKIPKIYLKIVWAKSQKESKKKCNGVKCTYKCDSSYSNAITQLDKEVKSIEGFGNIYNDYASFY